MQLFSSHAGLAFILKICEHFSAVFWVRICGCNKDLPCDSLETIFLGKDAQLNAGTLSHIGSGGNSSLLVYLSLSATILSLYNELNLCLILCFDLLEIGICTKMW